MRGSGDYLVVLYSQILERDRVGLRMGSQPARRTHRVRVHSGRSTSTTTPPGAATIARLFITPAEARRFGLAR